MGFRRQNINFIVYAMISYFLTSYNFLYSQYSEKTINPERFIYISESSIDMYSNFNKLLEFVEISGTKNIYFGINGLSPSSGDNKYSIPVDYPVSYTVVDAEISTFNADLYLKYDFYDSQVMFFWIYNSSDLTFYYNRRYSDDNTSWSYEKYLTGFGLQYSNVYFYSSIIRSIMPIISQNDNGEYYFSSTSDGDTQGKSKTEGYYFILDIYDFSNNLILDPKFKKIKFLNFKRTQYSVNSIVDLSLSVNYIDINNSYQPGVEVLKKDIIDFLNIKFNIYLNFYEDTDKDRKVGFAHSILKFSTFRGYWKHGEFDRDSESCLNFGNVFYFNLYLSYSRDIYDINLFGYNIGMGMFFSGELGTVNFEIAYSRNYFEDLLNLPVVNENLFYFKANFLY